MQDGRFGRDPDPRARRTTTTSGSPGSSSPGFANTHSHAFHRALRGRTHGGSGNFWTWREQMYAVTAAAEPRHLLRAGPSDVRRDGAGRHHRRRRVPLPAPQPVRTALRRPERHGRRPDRGGGRGRHPDHPARHLLPRRRPDRRGAHRARRRPAAVQRRLRRRVARPDVAARPPRAATARVGAAVHSVRAVPKPSLEEVGAWVEGQPIHVHLSEQPAENIACEMFYGCSPTELLADTGVLRPDVTAVHATHVSADDVKLLGAADAQASLLPDHRTRPGRRDRPRAGPRRRRGQPSLGSDQNAVVDPFEEIRGLEMNERLSTNERGRFRTDELVRVATANGYRSLGWFGGGVIAEGALADFVVVRDDTVRTVGQPGRPDRLRGDRRRRRDRRHRRPGRRRPRRAPAARLGRAAVPRRVRRAAGRTVTATTLVTGIGELTTMDPEHPDAEDAIGTLHDAALVLGRRPGALGRPAPRTTAGAPTAASTSAAAPSFPPSSTATRISSSPATAVPSSTPG